jgi:hypothetical protein
VRTWASPVPMRVFFLAEVDLDAPAPEVALEEFLEAHVRVGAEKVGGMAVEESGALAEGGSRRVSIEVAGRGVPGAEILKPEFPDKP